MSPSKQGAVATLRIVAVFALAYFVSYGLRTVNAIIAPELTREMALTANQLGLLTSAYLLSFMLFQLPLGILLDRYGPRRVEASLFVIAALGVMLFAASHQVTGLIAGRILIGLGVSACMMAAIKGFSLWVAPNRQAMATSWMMAIGMLGAIVSTSPMAALMDHWHWRSIFWALAIVMLVIAVLLVRWLPDAAPTSASSWVEQRQILAEILKEPRFLWLALIAGFGMGSFMAIQGLWSIPWLIGVDGLNRDQAARVILTMNVLVMCGSAALGSVDPLLRKRGITPAHSYLVGCGVSMLALLAIALRLPLSPYLTWGLYGFGLSVNAFCYLQITAAFRPQLSGRATTLLNLAMFLAAFLCQWLIGAQIDLWQALGLDRVTAFQYSLLLFALLNAAAWLQYAFYFRRYSKPRKETV